MNDIFNTKYPNIITSEKFPSSDISLTAIFSLASEAEIFFEQIKQLDEGSDTNPVRELNVYLLDRAILVAPPHFTNINTRIFACSFACQNSNEPLNQDYIPAGLSTLIRLIGKADGVASAGSIYLRENDTKLGAHTLEIIYSTALPPQLDNQLEPVRVAAGLASWHEGPTRLTYIDIPDCTYINDTPDFQTRSQWSQYVYSGLENGVYFFSPGPPPRINGLDNKQTEIWSAIRPPDQPTIPIFLNRIVSSHTS